MSWENSTHPRRDKSRARGIRILPDPCDTLEQAHRHAHADVPEMTTRDVWAELAVVRRELSKRLFYRLRDRPYVFPDGAFRSESAWLLDVLCRQAMVPEYQCRFRWQTGSVAFWDNRATQHYAASDYWPGRRVMDRIAIIGDRPS